MLDFEAKKYGKISKKMIFLKFPKMASKRFQMVRKHVLSTPRVLNQPQHASNMLRNDFQKISENQVLDLESHFFKRLLAAASLSNEKQRFPAIF